MLAVHEHAFLLFLFAFFVSRARYVMRSCSSFSLPLVPPDTYSLLIRSCYFFPIVPVSRYFYSLYHLPCSLFYFCTKLLYNYSYDIIIHYFTFIVLIILIVFFPHFDECYQ